MGNCQKLWQYYEGNGRLKAFCFHPFAQSPSVAQHPSHSSLTYLSGKAQQTSSSTYIACPIDYRSQMLCPTEMLLVGDI